MRALWDKLKARSASPWVLVVLMAVAFGTRLGANAVLVGLWTPPPPGSDSSEYDTYAWNLAQGRGYRGPSMDVEDRLNARGWIERLSLRQRAFVGVLCRVGRRCCLTTPNRFYAREENLNPLSERAFAAMVPAGYRLRTERFRQLGPVSNLKFLLERG